MDSDILCEEIKENLLNLGIEKNKTLNEISYLSIDDIRGFYKKILDDNKGHNFYFENKDIKMNAKISYKFFVNLFQEYGAITLRDIIPSEYLTDLVGALDRTLVRTHEMEKILIKSDINKRSTRNKKLTESNERNKIKNYNKFYANEYGINKEMKALKKKEKLENKKKIIEKAESDKKNKKKKKFWLF